jgi:hypothetical protein
MNPTSNIPIRNADVPIGINPPPVTRHSGSAANPPSKLQKLDQVGYQNMSMCGTDPVYKSLATQSGSRLLPKLLIEELSAAGGNYSALSNSSN